MARRVGRADPLSSLQRSAAREATRLVISSLCCCLLLWIVADPHGKLIEAGRRTGQAMYRSPLVPLVPGPHVNSRLQVIGRSALVELVLAG
jgi:hypothetical protein